MYLINKSHFQSRSNFKQKCKSHRELCGMSFFFFFCFMKPFKKIKKFTPNLEELSLSVLNDFCAEELRDGFEFVFSPDIISSG